MKNPNYLFFLFFIKVAIIEAQTSITYDDLGRATDIVYNDGTAVHYVYDDVGNRIGETITTTNACERPALLTGTPQASHVGVSTVETTTPWPSGLNNAVLALESTEKGFVITRMADPETTIGAGAVEGMLVYDTAAKCFKLYDGTAWGCIKQGCPD